MSAEEQELRRLFGELADRQAVHGTDGAWLRARLRRRRARQAALAAGVAAVALVGAALGVTLPDRDGSVVTATSPPSPAASSSPTAGSAPAAPPVPPPLTARTGARLLVVQGTQLQLLDVDSGSRTTLPTVPRAGDYDRLDALAVGGELVLVGDNQTGAGSGPYPVYATTAGPGTALRQIGVAGSLIPSDQPGRVWLSVVQDASPPVTTLTEVDVRGREFRHARLDRTFGAVPFDGGYLRQAPQADGSPGDNAELVDATGRRSQLYNAASLVVVRGRNAVLEGVQPCDPCRLSLLAGGAGDRRDITFQTLPFLQETGLTNDATRLYTSVHQEGLDDRHGLLYSRITELDLVAGTSRPVEEAWSATYYGPSFQFSPDGRWMFFIDADGRSIDALDLQNRHAYRVRGSFDTITQLALL